MEPGGGGECEGGVEREGMVRQFEELWHAKLTGFHKDDYILNLNKTSQIYIQLKAQSVGHFKIFSFPFVAFVGYS